MYITEMLRWGNDETHHYIIGVFSSLKEAKYNGEVEKAWRGGKYEYRIVEAELDAGLDSEKKAWYEKCTK